MTAPWPADLPPIVTRDPAAAQVLGSLLWAGHTLSRLRATQAVCPGQSGLVAVLRAPDGRLLATSTTALHGAPWRPEGRSSHALTIVAFLDDWPDRATMPGECRCHRQQLIPVGWLREQIAAGRRRAVWTPADPAG